MKNSIVKNIWFTLVEILVSITVLSIIMISVMSIFVSATDISLKSDINRIMQENIKNVVETIAEDVRKNWVSWVSESSTDLFCDFSVNVGNSYKKWTKLCTVSWDEYFLAKRDSFWNIIRVSDATTDCSSIDKNCLIAKYSIPLSNPVPLSNKSVSFKDLKFYVSDNDISKVTINFTLQPAVKRWVKSSLIEENKIIFQTTISERLIKNN